MRVKSTCSVKFWKRPKPTKSTPSCAASLAVRMNRRRTCRHAAQAAAENRNRAWRGRVSLYLYELLKVAVEDHRWRVEKGERGADVIHEVKRNGKVVGKIVYDRNNRGKWLNKYATKLREDQITEGADHAILSTNKFPKGKRELCVHEHVILASPARVVALAEILRSDIVHNDEARGQQRGARMRRPPRCTSSLPRFNAYNFLSRSKR